MVQSFLTLEQFLSFFPEISITKDEFLSRFKIMYTKPVLLKDIYTPENKLIKRETDVRRIKKEQIIDYFYKCLITHRRKNLTDFYSSYFSFKHPEELKWTGVDITGDGNNMLSVQKNDASKRIIRNLFAIELLGQTEVSNTVKSSMSFWDSLLAMFNRLELEGRFFAPSSIDLMLKAGDCKTLFYLFQAYQPKASIFNPYVAAWILENLMAGTKLFTPVIDWGSYALAYTQLPRYTDYVGVDVMDSVCIKTGHLLREFGMGKKHRIIKCPSERLLLDKEFTTLYNKYFDSILVCPPYYDMELYHEGEQSTDMYKTYEEWLEKYWRATVMLTRGVATPDARFAVIINDYKTLDGKEYRLTEDMDKITKECGWELLNIFYLKNRTSPLRAAAKERTERLYFYRGTVCPP